MRERDEDELAADPRTMPHFIDAHATILHALVAELTDCGREGEYALDTVLQTVAHQPH
jgi:hypothetical protein